MGINWDHDEFRQYVTARAATLGAQKSSDIARLAGLSHSLVSKWFNGLERPSSGSIAKLAKGLDVPELDLLILSGHVTTQTASVTVPPQPKAKQEPEPEPKFDPLVYRLARLLGEESPISTVEQAMIRTVIERLIAPYSTGTVRRR